MRLLIATFISLLLTISLKAQVFTVESVQTTYGGYHYKYVNDSTVFVGTDNGIYKTNLYNDLTWFTFANPSTNCLQGRNICEALLLTDDGGCITLFNIDESCIPFKTFLIKLDSNGNQEWLYEFEQGRRLRRGAIVFDSNHYHVYAVHAMTMSSNDVNKISRLKIDTNGVLIEDSSSVEWYNFDFLQELDDSLLVVRNHTPPPGTDNHCLEIWSKDLSTKRVIQCFDSVKPTYIYLQGDTFYMSLQSTKNPRSVSGVGKVARNGGGLESFINTSHRHMYYGVVVVDSFVITIENHREGYFSTDDKSYINIFDKSMNSRVREEFPIYHGGWTNISLFNFGDTLLHTFRGKNAFISFDFSKIPPLPEDTIPGDTTKISVPELLKKSQTTLFPNPTTTHFTLQSTQNINHIQVFDLRGALVLEQSVQSTEHQVQLSEAGTYIIHIHLQDGSTERQKVVKMKE